LAGRKEDQLLLPYQKKLSRSLRYQDKKHITGSEKFMKDLYRYLNRIRYGHEEFLEKILDIIEPLALEPTPNRLSHDFQVTKGKIVLRKGRLSEKPPIVILKGLEEANQWGFFLGSEFIWEARKIIDTQGKRLVVSPEARELFLNLILEPKNPKITRLALEIGLVTLFIPEFKKIRNLVESGFYHVETVDLHSLRTLEMVNGISKGAYDEKWPMLKETFSELEHPDQLFLAALLHDIGKGHGEDHSERGAALTPKILKRLGIEGVALKVIPFMVRHHQLLTHISQHRDLGDEKTSVQVAQIIQDKDILQMLFLVTVADSLATGPMARSDWKIMLLVELFLKVRRILERGVLASQDATNRIEAKKRLITDRMSQHFLKRDILQLINQIPSRYFLNTNSEDIVRHFHLALTIGDKKLSWKLQKLSNAPVTRMILCTYDKPGLFGKIVGVLTLNNIIVLSVRIFTLRNGLAFDLYEVTNPKDPLREAEMWDKIQKELGLALEDQMPLDELIRKKGRGMLASGKYRIPQAKNVQINNEVSDFFSIIEFSSETKMGLLYELAKVVFSKNLDIRFAIFNSDEEKMTGDFYVRDSFGQKILEEDKIDEIEQAILGVMG